MEQADEWQPSRRESHNSSSECRNCASSPSIFPPGRICACGASARIQTGLIHSLEDTRRRRELKFDLRESERDRKNSKYSESRVEEWKCSVRADSWPAGHTLSSTSSSSESDSSLLSSSSESSAKHTSSQWRVQGETQSQHQDHVRHFTGVSPSSPAGPLFFTFLIFFQKTFVRNSFNLFMLTAVCMAPIRAVSLSCKLRISARFSSSCW